MEGIKTKLWDILRLVKLVLSLEAVDFLRRHLNPSRFFKNLIYIICQIVCLLLDLLNIFHAAVHKLKDSLN